MIGRKLPLAVPKGDLEISADHVNFNNKLGILMKGEPMSKTLARVKNLEQFIAKHGDDVLISRTISKMLNYKIQQYEAEIRRLGKQLRKFERVHKMKSADFFRDFMEGKLGDDLDLVEWSSLYQMRQHLLEKKAVLEGA